MPELGFSARMRIIPGPVTAADYVCVADFIDSRLPIAELGTS